MSRLRGAVLALTLAACSVKSEGILMVDVPQMTESYWQGAFTTAMCRVNETLGRKGCCVPSRAVDVPFALDVLQALRTGAYSPDAYFQTGPAPSGADHQATVPPPVEPEAEYVLIRLQALTRLGVETSITFGGVVFEDPMLAIAAAWQIAGHRESPLVVPRAFDYDDLWARRATVLANLPDPWATQPDAAEPALAGLRPSEAMAFDTVVVRGSDLLDMRRRGAKSLLVQGQLVLLQLFHVVPRG